MSDTRITICVPDAPRITICVPDAPRITICVPDAPQVIAGIVNIEGYFD